MRFIFAINDPKFFLSHRIALAESSIKYGHEVFLLSDFSDFDPSIIIKQGIQPIHIDVSRASTSLFLNLKFFLTLIKIYKKYKPDLLHQITLKFYLFGTLSTFFFKNNIKIINAVTGLGYLYTAQRQFLIKKIIDSFLRFTIIKKDSYFIFQNSVDAYQFKKLGLKENYILIKGSGVDHKEFSYKPESDNKKINIVFTGRILKDKGLIELIQAAKQLPDSIKNKVFFKIYGKLDLENPAYI